MSMKPYIDDVRRVTDHCRKMVSAFGAFDLEKEYDSLTPEAKILCVEIPRLLAQLESPEARCTHN